ncbi:Bug family tripartite tricarboxylate transporter substrate binding protein [Roseococcus sp. YIM B11640]|uniref:Bug family tripartite tricarboxylate transporter substrate binding protein n=1 Tax=Roseococcus sp. YIM B11640 TaxID=3133973 RepID=UPI003C7E0712
MIRIPRRGLLAATILAAPAVRAQSYPSRPIRAVVPFPAGGGVDAFARAVAPALSATLGQGVVIENLGGASSRLGTVSVLRAPADGHTILITNDTLAAVEALPIPGTGSLVAGLAPVLLGVSAPHALVVNPRAGIPDASTYAARLRSGRPPNIGVPGLGSAQHFASELLGQALGGRAEHVAYRGGGPLIVDVLSGTLDGGMVTLNAAIDHIRDGRLLALGTTGGGRSPAAPEIPTFAETIAPGFDIETWMGILAPAGTPEPILAALHAASLTALREPGVTRRLNGQGFSTPGLGPAPFGALLQETVARFAAVAGAVGLKPDA